MFSRDRSSPRARIGVAAATLIGVTAALSGCAGGGSGDGRVTLDFFQFKGEAAADFQQIVTDFEADNPDIDVVINQVPDPDTAIRTLLVKNKVPDVITLNGSGNFGRLAMAGVFHDFTGDPLIDQFNPAVMEILDALGTFNGDEINSLPVANNANGVIYNKGIFEEQGLEVPTTWDELIEVCETLQEAGVTPFYGTMADAWTAAPSFNSLGGQLQPEGFFESLREQGSSGPDQPVSFSKDYRETFEKLAELYGFTQEDYRSRTYEDGNAAFARGEAAMYLQGIWALNPILGNNPDIELGVFPMPASESAAETRLTSGVDVVVTMGRDTPHPEESRRFIEYLLSPEVLEAYAQSQFAFSPIEDATQPDDPSLAEIVPFFEEGRIIGFIDHQIPAAVPLQPILQQYLFDENLDGALQDLDNEWSKVAARTTPPKEN
jgi:raffinose/stachyose/melibiose transport system substrate-binding protein